MGKEIESVLLMRVLSHAELYNTREAPDQVLRAFPGARLVGLGAAECADTALLGADPRLDDLLLLPPGVAGSPRAFRAFMRRQPCDATVMCFGATPGIAYPKQILASLLCPGRHFLLDAAGELFPALSRRGLTVILRAALGIVFLALLRATLRLAARLTPADPAAVAGPGLPAPEHVRRLLFIRLDHIGDVAMSLPALRALRRRYPDARIDALVLPGVAPLLADVPDVDRVIPYAAPVFTRAPGRRAGLWGTLALVRRLRRERYDVAVDLRGNDLCRLLAFLAGARRRVGPDRSQYEMSGRPNYGFLLTHPVALPGGPEHAVARSLGTLYACGLSPDDSLEDAPYRLSVAPVRRSAVRGALAGLGAGRDYAVIHARPSEESRQWDPERFAAVADHLGRVHGLDVLLTGAPCDHDYNADIAARTAHPARVFNAAGLLALPELPALFQGAALMVSVDTGPMHVAALVGTPLVTLFHPALACLHHPYGQEDGVLVPPGEADVRRGVWEAGPLSAIPLEDVLAMVDRKLGVGVSVRLPVRRVSGTEELAQAA